MIKIDHQILTCHERPLLPGYLNPKILGVGFSLPHDDSPATRQTDRQTNGFIKNSIEAGILLGGNGVIHAMAIARALVLVQS
jgi:hypothetical protein